MTQEQADVAVAWLAFGLVIGHLLVHLLGWSFGV